MRRYPLVLLCLLACQPVLAISFQTRLEKVEWQVEGDQFECRLSQPITDFGAGVFVRRAGEQVTFRMQARERWLGTGSATLLAAAAPADAAALKALADRRADVVKAYLIERLPADRVRLAASKVLTAAEAPASGGLAGVMLSLQ